MGPKISILIPAYEEQGQIGDTIGALISRGYEDIIVIDDGSRDGTGEAAAQAGAKRVIRLKNNLGKGKALSKGLEFAEGDIIVFLDADLGPSAKEVDKLILPLVSEDVDMAIAKFPKPEKRGGFGLVVALARFGIKWLTGVRMEAPLSGQRAIKRQLLNEIGEIEEGFGVEVGLTIDALRRKAKVLEVETSMSHIQTGRDLKGFLHRGKQFLDALRVIMKKWFFSLFSSL